MKRKIGDLIDGMNWNGRQCIRGDFVNDIVLSGQSAADAVGDPFHGSARFICFPFLFPHFFSREIGEKNKNQEEAVWFFFACCFDLAAPLSPSEKLRRKNGNKKKNFGFFFRAGWSLDETMLNLSDRRQTWSTFWNAEQLSTSMRWDSDVRSVIDFLKRTFSLVVVRRINIAVGAILRWCGCCIRLIISRENVGGVDR